MEDKIVDPQHCSSVQDYLTALGFIVNGDYFVKGNVAIPSVEIVGHTPVTFAEKAERKGWLEVWAIAPPGLFWGHVYGFTD